MTKLYINDEVDSDKNTPKATKDNINTNNRNTATIDNKDNYEHKSYVYDILMDCNAIKEGHFILASGNHSAHYVQCAMLMQFPSKLVDILNIMVSTLPDNIDVVFVPAIGGIPLGVELAHLLGCKSIFAERDNYNNMVLKRNFNISENENILIAEDVMTTGGTVKELIQIANHKKANIVAIYTLINRMNNNQFLDYKVYSSLNIDFPVFKKEDCPLCKKGIATERPGTKKI